MAEQTNNQPQREEPSLSELLQIRRDKLAELQKQGQDPFRITKFDVTHHSDEVKDQFDAMEGQTVRVAGRLMSKRGMGKAVFSDLQDGAGRIQLYVRIDDVGEEALARLLGDNPAFSVFATALVGLIPNCAASVVIAQLYVEGVLGAGAMLAGLLVSAGVGLLVLVRANRPWRQNAAIIALLYVIGVFWGLVCNALGVVF